MDIVKWLYPGMHIKRWIAGLVVGVAIIAAGLTYVIIQFLIPPDATFYTRLPWATPYIAIAVGLVLSALSLGGLYLALVSPLRPREVEALVNRIYRYRRRQRGPRVVAIGGGTGLATLLRGLKEHTDYLTAIVTVADDGGSSGRLRRELGVLPPGDFRNCIVALAETEPIMARLFEHRFGAGSGLEGHSFGNLFITAMSGVTGKFSEAVKETSRVLAVRGQVLPSTLDSVSLVARMVDGHTVYGEASIPNSGRRIQQVELEPADAEAYPEAIQAIQEAELIVVGPGSLYTSILPNLLVTGIARAIRESTAMKVYVCNVATQPGETDGFSLAAHVEALHSHMGNGLVRYVLANNNVAPLPAEWPNRVVEWEGTAIPGVVVMAADLVNEDYRLRHHPGKLASSLMALYYGGRDRPRLWR